MSVPGLPRLLTATEAPPAAPAKRGGALARLPQLELQLGVLRLLVGLGLGARGLLIDQHRAMVLALGALLVIFSAASLYEFLSGDTDTDPKLVAAVLFITDAVAGGLCASVLSLPAAVVVAVGLFLAVAGSRRRRPLGAVAAAGLFAAAYVGAGMAILVYEARSAEAATVAGDVLIVAAVLVGAAAFIQWQSDLLHRLGSERHLLEASLADAARSDAEGRFHSERLLESVSDGVVTIDSEGLIVGVNAGAADLLGTPPEALLGRGITQLIDDGEADAFAYFLWANMRSETDGTYFSRAHETRLRRPTGDAVTVELRVGEILRGEERLFACDLRDISDQKARMEVLEYRAMHDPLTALPNRALFADRLRNAISMAGRQEGVVGLLLLDLDGFKDINDSLGHACGDQLLRQVTERLLTCVRESDTVARLGGDEFAVIAPDQTQMGATHILAQRLQDAFQTPFVLDGQVARISASVGIALYPEHATEDVSLLRQADVAMYIAKAERTGFFVYSPERDEHSAQRMMRLAELNNAIIRDELVLHYQPKVAIATGEVVGVEALVRWQHPQHGLVFPDDFVPVVEGTELMWPMTEKIVRKALGQSRKWQEAGMDLTVSVNLSAGSLSDRDVGRKISALLAEVGVAGKTLTVEITESSLMAEGAAQALSGIRASGAGLSADDFGTGFSSLTALKEMPLTELKIDKSFVLRMDQEVKDAAIVGPIVELGRKRGLSVVAEGVENAEIYRMLADFNCDLAQGYHIAKPMAAWDLEGWLRTGQWRPRMRTAASEPIPAPVEPAAPDQAPEPVPVQELPEVDLTPHERALAHLFEPDRNEDAAAEATDTRTPYRPPMQLPAPALPEPALPEPVAAIRLPEPPLRLPEPEPEPVMAAPAAAPAPESTQPPRVRRAAKQRVEVSPPQDLRGAHRRQRALNRGLEAVIAFVDAAPRRAHAEACAEVLQRAVPKRERGASLTAFLEAYHADERPGMLQELAEDAGVELALAIKQINLEIHAAA